MSPVKSNIPFRTIAINPTGKTDPEISYLIPGTVVPVEQTVARAPPTAIKSFAIKALASQSPGVKFALYFPASPASETISTSLFALHPPFYIFIEYSIYG